MQWNAKPKVGSLENKTHKPGGGDKKIETVKLDFKDKAKPKIGSKDNIKHTPGGGAVKVKYIIQRLNKKIMYKYIILRFNLICHCKYFVNCAQR